VNEILQVTGSKARSFGMSRSQNKGVRSGARSFRSCWLSAKESCWCILCVIVVIGASSCKKPLGAIPVHGRVAYLGQALKSARITFFPGTGRPITTGISDSEYTAELPPGDYTVVINVGTDLPPGFKEGDPLPPPPKLVLPVQYSTRATSTLKATVKERQNEPTDFDLK
jgi:hypothetical protein